MQDQCEVNSLVEILVILDGEQSETILDEPMLQDVVIDLLRIPVGAYLSHLLYLHLALLPPSR